MRLRLLSYMLVVGVVAALVFSLFGRDRSLDRLQQVGVIRIGYAVEPPYAFVQGNGTVSGEAPEIARLIVARLGIAKADWQQMEFGELIDALLEGRIDVIAAGMFITPERQRRLLFSVPTMAVEPALLVARGNPKGITSYRKAAGTAGLRIAVLAGAVEGKILRDLGMPESRLLVVPDALTGRQAVETGLADTLMLSEPTVRWMSQREQLGRTEMRVTPATERGENVYGHPAFAFRPDARQLQAAWNAALIPYLTSPQHQALLTGLGLKDLAKARSVP